MNGGLQFVAPLHGGPDARGAVAHDFSTNANGCGPCPVVLEALQAADAQRYPDPSYVGLRERLAGFHGVMADRIFIAASASEFIFRMTAAIAATGGRRLALPRHAYGDYARAAEAWGLEPVVEAAGADLVWCCDPSSPLGQPEGASQRTVRERHPGATCVIDLAYEPLRLDGALALDPVSRDAVWQLWTPNKAMGLTGVRAAYAIAPLPGQAGAGTDGWRSSSEDTAARVAGQLAALAPSWPVGAHGVALLETWTGPAAQAWLARSRETLSAWKARQRALCAALGWRCQPGVANFFCARPDRALTPARVEALRSAGVRLRDTTSFGLPGQVRLGVLPPASQQALAEAWRALP